MRRWRGLLGVALLLVAGCTPGPQATPTPTVGIPPEALSELFTAVALVGTQAAQMQDAAALATATGTATPAEPEPSEPEDETSVQTEGARPAPAPRPVAVAPDAAAPCSLGQLKGNQNSMIYHVPGGGSYARTRANVVCFDSEAQAEAAGYRKARN